jgi:cytochrome c oxidase subunit 2
MPARVTPDQSTFTPAGVNAVLIDELSTVLYVGVAIVFTVVIVLALYALFRGPRPVSASAWIVGGGIAFPAVGLTAVLVYALMMGNALSVEAPDSATTIRITGKRWWWEVRYPHPASQDGVIVAANELHLPVGREVRLLLDTHDVIHSFWVPPLSGKIDMIPGRVNHLVLRAARPVIYRAQCAEYCGAQHALMALYVVVHEPGDFERWLEREARAAPAAVHADELRGAGLFAAAGCAGCHAVRGTSAAGTLGPDLTHVASRLSLGAGVIDNNRGALAGWISNSQGLKPGNLMPPIKVSPDELHALTAYVAALK